MRAAIHPYYAPGIKRNPARRTYNDFQLMKIIMTIVCKHYNLQPWEVIGSRRHRAYVQARQMFCYLTRTTRQTIPLKKIGQAIGGRDHSTVIHAVRQIQNELSYDKQVQLASEILNNHIKEFI